MAQVWLKEFAFSLPILAIEKQTNKHKTKEIITIQTASWLKKILQS